MRGSKLVKRARKLRKEMTDTERFVWSQLRSRRFVGFKFGRQVPVAGFIVDFVCLQSRLIIELDGGQHVENKSYDEWRSKLIEQEGFQVIRFWNHEALQEWEVVEEAIWNALHKHPLTPNPSPPRGEGRKQ